MTLDSALWFAGSFAEAAVIGLLVYRRVWRTLPVFFSYSIWALVGSFVAYAVHCKFPRHYGTAYLLELIIDSGLLLAILVELAWSVLRPVRVYLRRSALIYIAGGLLLLGAAIWPFASLPALDLPTHKLHLVVQLQQTVSILQILFLLALIACSQLLSIGWRNREFQVATGLGFYSVVNLTIAMLHMHETAISQYQLLNRVLIASYICSLLYWIVSFAQREAERHEFTPQMQNMLLAVAGAARTTRVALADAQAHKDRPRDGI